jgi:DNA-binding NtrC family response regulator
MDQNNQTWTSSITARANGSIGPMGSTGSTGALIGVPAFVSRSLAMHRLCERLPHIGGARLILIEGEAGSGKQLLARHIRGLRPAAGNIVIEEASDLLHEEEPQRPGYYAERLANAVKDAARGLLLLRGIDELGALEQGQLLRFIRSFEAGISSGGPEQSSAPFQVVCTARQALRSRVLAGKFQPELFYRLSAVCLALPALRERKEDIPGLAQIFIDAFARESRKPLQGLGPGALAVLLRHRWPGNVRELESVIRAACFAAEGQWVRPIDLVILPLETVQAPANNPEHQDLNLDGVLRRHVQRVLRVCAGNKARAAARLGISRSTLYRMLESSADSAFQGANFDRAEESPYSDEAPAPHPHLLADQVST